jgi:hypothetical protein
VGSAELEAVEEVCGVCLGEEGEWVGVRLPPEAEMGGRLLRQSLQLRRVGRGRRTRL